tara:strand:- start:853 stop:981 length:129 start_codon:yes stop_codon:yes gene_type:complete
MRHMGKARVILATPFILFSALFKLIALAILPKEHREDGKKFI